MRYLLLVIGITFFSVTARSQNFDYSFAKDSVAWQELNTQTILNANNSAWNFSYKIPIGFTFNYLGKNFDSLRIETNGYVVFDADHNYALTAFLGFGDCVDTSGNHAVLGYEISGSNGNHVLKIQFKSTGTSQHTPKHLSYQVWLKENNSLEIHVGPNDYQPQRIVSSDSSFVESVLPDSSGQSTDSLVVTNETVFMNTDSLQAYRFGLLNMNMDRQTSGFFIGGDVASPQSQPVNANNPEPVYLMRAPSSGTRYTFTPNSN
ncbi:MAG TPA: hypothetical protein VFJ43_06675 [Bacteroidia bacterium]|nr:hypothetical protein [Bacteroidia bacterium]